MRRGGRPFLGWVAILAIALHTVLWGAVPLASAAATNPFSVICFSATHATSQSDHIPGQVPESAACDHCNFCTASAAPSASLDNIIAGQFEPAKLLQILRPATATAPEGIASSPHQARGPPHLT